MNKNICNQNSDNEKPIPISIAIENIKNQIENIILSSSIPASILELITKDIYLQTRDAAKVIYEKEKEKYEESLKESTTNKS